MTAESTRSHALRSMVLCTFCLLAALLSIMVPKAGAVVAWHHGFTVPYGGNYAGEHENWGRALTAEMGSDTMRISLSWDAYQTGVNQYNQQVLDDIVAKVQAARAWSPNPFNPKALITFELPNYDTDVGNTKVKWMQEAGYQLTAGEFSGGGNTSRYYPASRIGAEAYGKAMAKALKYLYNVQIAIAIETPNEPNLKKGPAWAVPAEYIGRLGAYGLAYAAAEGLPVTSPGGPVVLVGSVSSNPDTQYSSEGKTPGQYFRLVQTSTNYWLDNFYLGTPNGKATAELLMGTWRASFHSYPDTGGGEQYSCQKNVKPYYGGQYKTQDEVGNLTGLAANSEAWNRLGSLLAVLDEVPWKKKWWITETGMTSYKTNVAESEVECNARRVQGGSAYGKAQQKSFYQEMAYNADVRYHSGVYPGSGFEGLIFFQPQDGSEGAADQFKGFGAFALGCGNYCWKPAAEYFANTL